jgi:predicted transcriptional regulator
MHDKAIPRTDRGVQRAVLALALEAHPKSLTIPDLAREIDRGDAVERDVRDLVSVGLLVCEGVTIRPSAAALHYYRLDLP